MELTQTMLLPSGTGLVDAIVVRYCFAMKISSIASVHCHNYSSIIQFAVPLVFCRYLFSMAFQLSRSMLSELIYIPPPFPIGGIKQYEFQHHRFKLMTAEWAFISWIIYSYASAQVQWHVDTGLFIWPAKWVFVPLVLLCLLRHTAYVCQSTWEIMALNSGINKYNTCW